MDRAILEGDPHSVLEAMAIAGHAIGANKGVIYLRDEYKLALKRLGIAMQQAKEIGFLGDNIMGSGFSFDIEIWCGGERYICGQTGALVKSIEGGKGVPMPKVPHLTDYGLYGKPTLVNNVETLANIPKIIRNGGDWYAKMGLIENIITPEGPRTIYNTGTKVFTLSGKAQHTGLVEVELGKSLDYIVNVIGGGVKVGKLLKAVQTGGPSGGFIPAWLLHELVTFENLKKLGSIMGSGGFAVLDNDDCMIDMARYFTDFSQIESCRKCPPCVNGAAQARYILDEIIAGRGKEVYLKQLQDLAAVVKDGSFCGLGQSAFNPLLSSMKYFWAEYEAHILGKTCPANVCAALSRGISIEKRSLDLALEFRKPWK